jgi:class 3 adenylate cyclase
MVGYSRLMAADEAGTHARLTALRKGLVEPKIGERQGRLVKLTGDGALEPARPESRAPNQSDASWWTSGPHTIGATNCSRQEVC